MNDSIDRKATIEYILEILNNMPSAEPKRGKWIIKKDGLFNGNFGICSECGNYLIFAAVNIGLGNANYCPNCGARMESDE